MLGFITVDNSWTLVLLEGVLKVDFNAEQARFLGVQTTGRVVFTGRESVEMRHVVDNI